VQKRISSDGATVIGSTPETLAKTIEADIARWGRVIRQANLSLDTPR
jgi:tripartite-type tricarboxylate transporter receptor subunit TctC